MSSFRALALLVLAGCSRQGEENLGLKQAPVAAVDPAQLTQPSQLLRALSLPGAARDAHLGAHHFEASATLKIEPPGKPAESLAETWKLDSDGKGAVHLLHENDHRTGMEAIVSSGLLYVRPRFGKFVERKPEPDEVERLRATVEAVAADDLALVQHALVAREEARTTIGGRPAVKIKLSAAPSPAAAPKESDPGKKWRETLQVRYIDGEVAVDAASGALLSARLSLSYSFEREGTKGPFQAALSYTASTGAPGTTIDAITAPVDFAAAPHRTRPMLDRTELLEGLK
jgi:hypothetical protein